MLSSKAFVQNVNHFTKHICEEKEVAGCDHYDDDDDDHYQNTYTKSLGFQFETRLRRAVSDLHLFVKHKIKNCFHACFTK